MCVLSVKSLYLCKEVIKCDYFHFISVCFFATVGNAVLTLALIFVSCCHWCTIILTT
jgi:hypothetical protein